MKIFSSLINDVLCAYCRLEMAEFLEETKFVCSFAYLSAGYSGYRRNIFDLFVGRIIASVG